CSFFFSSRRRHTRCYRDWSSDVCSSDLEVVGFVRRKTSAIPELDLSGAAGGRGAHGEWRRIGGIGSRRHEGGVHRRRIVDQDGRSEERRVGEGGRGRW